MAVLSLAGGSIEGGETQGDPDRTSHFPDLDLASEPKVKWVYPKDGELAFKSVGGISVEGGLVFGSDGEGRKFALNARDGNLRWQNKPEDQTMTSPAPGLAGRYVVYAHEKGVVAHQSEKGDEIWSVKLQRGTQEASPVIFDGSVYVATYEGIAYRFELETGKEVWQHDFASDRPDDPDEEFAGNKARFSDIGARPRSGACDGEIFVVPVFDQSRIVAMDCRTGARRWAFQARGWIYGTPVITAKYVLTGSQDKKIYCVDKQTGKVVWESEPGGSRIEMPGASDGVNYAIGSCDGVLRWGNLETGKVAWTFETDRSTTFASALYSAVLIGRERMYLATLGGEIYAIDREGNLEWRMRVDPGSEILDFESDGDRLYVATRRGEKDGRAAIFALGAKE